MPDNLLWIFCEDLSPWFSAYGDPTVPTPVLDQLARDGVVFRHCHSPAPVCSPARSGIITGCWPSSIGAHQHVSSRTWVGMPPIHLPEPVRPLPALLREAGYFTYNLGKDDYNFVYRREDLYAGPYEALEFYGPQHVGHRMHHYPRDWAFWRQRAPGQPFFGQVTLWAGKTPRLVAPPTDPASIRLERCYPDTPTFRAQRARHYDQIRTTDAEVGEIIEALRADGLLASTWIVFMSDHGYDMLRAKQFCYDGGTHVPLLIRPPDGAGAPFARGSVREDMTSSLDVTATTLGLLGQPIPDWMQSRDLFGPTYRRDYVVSGRDRCDGSIDLTRSVRTRRYRYVRNFLPDRPLMQPQYRSESPCFLEYRQLWREGKLAPEAAYFAGDDRLPEELYDHATDPDEARNLAADPAHAEALGQHRAMLAEWQQEIGDRGGQPEPIEQYRWLIQKWGPEQCWGPEYDAARS
jgi:N-sulfoglucosamine sulfohydrolase